MKYEIKSWLNGDVLFSIETDSFKLALEAAVKSGANLSGADLSGVNLFGANLSGANLFGEKLTKTPIQILGLTWPVFITTKQIKIGCEIHEAEEWEKFKDSRITLMHPNALEFWTKHKDMILGLHKIHAGDK